MKIDKTGGGDWQIVPEGEYQAVLVDMIDQGWKETFFQGESKGYAAFFKPVFQIEELLDSGERMSVWHFPHSVKWHEKARWHQFLTGLLGATKLKAIMEGEEFDPDSLIGVNCEITVVHTPDKTDANKVWANISEIVRWREKMGEEIFPEGYIRQCDKPDWEDKRPTLSAYLPYPGDTRTGKLDNTTTTALAAPPVAQSTPAPVAVAPVEAAPVRTPDSMLSTMMTEGPKIFGGDFLKHLNKLAGKGNSVFELTEAQAGQVIAAMRATSPAKGVKAKMEAMASDDDEMDDDPFADEDPGSMTTEELRASAFKTPEAYPVG